MSGMTAEANGEPVIGWLTILSAQVTERANKLVQQYGLLLLARVKANAAGRPGPRIVTGDYNRSINLRVTGGLRPEASVGTNRPQARRLEYGFRGVDARGRRYNQPPYPHFGPAFGEVAPKFQEAAARLLTAE